MPSKSRGPQAEEHNDKITALVDALKNYVRAEVHSELHPDESSEMGPYYEIKALRETLVALLGGDDA